MRFDRGLTLLFGAAMTTGCLSETLIDNYDARPPGNQSGGQSGVPTRYQTDLPGVLPTSLPTGQPLGVVVPIPRMHAASGGVTGSVYQGGGGTVADVRTAGGSSNIAGAGSFGIAQASHASQHHLERYVAFELLDSSGSDIGLGVTEADHLIAMVSTNAAAYLRSESSAIVPGLLEVLPTGESLRYRVFWGGTRPDVFAVESNGAVVMSGRLDRDVNYGGSTIKQLEHGFYLVKLDADWNPVFELGVPTDSDVTPSKLVVDAGGRISLALLKARSDGEGLDVELAEFTADGTPNGSWPIASGMGVKLGGMATDGTGNRLFAGQFATTLSTGAVTVDSRGLSDGWIGAWSASRSELENVRYFGGTGSDSAIGIVPGVSSGELQIAAVASGRATFFGETANLSSRGAPLVVGLDASGKPSWITQLASEGTVLDFLRSGDRTYVAGTLNGLSTKTGYYRNQLFMAELDADGAASSFFTIDANATGPTHLAVDSQRTIWLSGRANVVPAGGDIPTDSYVLLQLVKNAD